MNLTWLSLIPPLVVIGTMLITQRLNISLMAAIISAAIITAQGQPAPAFSFCIQKIIEHFSDSDMIFLYTLLIVISSLIILLNTTGSAVTCARVMSKKMKTARSGELSTIALAFLLSIDDYLSILTTGLVMSPMADKLGIVRTKLAYIIHALAGPLVIIVPISTWAAAILAQLDTAGVNQSSTSYILADPFHVYLNVIPFVFYSIFTVLAVNVVVYTRMKLGVIGEVERSVSFPMAMPNADRRQENDSIVELLIPISLLIAGVFLGVLYAGGYHLFGGNHSLIEAFRHNNKTFLVLLVSSVVSLGTSILLSLHKKTISFRQLPAIFFEGFCLIRSSIVMVILASILGSFLRFDLQTGTYIASLLLGKTPLFLIPVLLFIVSLLITLMTGSAWGAFSMLIPISTQMLMTFLQLSSPVSLSQIPILFPSLGAVLSGAACGNHLSPFAETTFMTAASTNTDPLDHAKTQFIYAIPVFIASCVSFLLVGVMVDNNIGHSLFVSFFVGMVVMGLLLAGLHYWYRNKTF